jgi:hypothetical protein
MTQVLVNAALATAVPEMRPGHPWPVTLDDVDNDNDEYLFARTLVHGGWERGFCSGSTTTTSETLSTRPRYFPADGCNLVCRVVNASTCTTLDSIRGTLRRMKSRLL